MFFNALYALDAMDDRSLILSNTNDLSTQVDFISSIDNPFSKFNQFRC